MKQDETYNGWTNYETWLVALWLDNERGSYEYWNSVAAEISLTSSPEYIADESDRLRILSDRMKDEVEEGSPLPDAGIYTDLLNAALSEVDWREVAEHYLAVVEEA